VVDLPEARGVVLRADSGSDVPQEFRGAVRIAGGVVVGEIGNGEHIGESRSGDVVVEIVAADKAMTGVAAARSATAAGSLPCSVWLSSRPSPVITRSASATRRSKSKRSKK
jgi:hypothetical protein